MKVDCTVSWQKMLTKVLPFLFTCRTPSSSWDHLVGLGLFLGLYPWRGNGIGNDAPKDIRKLVSQFAGSGGKFVQVQLLYEEGAVFAKGKGLKLDDSKLGYCADFRDMCAENGVCVGFVLFDHCTLKYPDKWAVCPLNKANGGPFGQPFDVYSNFGMVSQYVSDMVKKLDGDNVCFEIINEGENANFAGQVRDLLKSKGVSRMFTSGDNPGGLWRYSAHGQTSPGAVRAGQLPNTDGRDWSMSDVRPICNAVRAVVGSGLVFDGATDAHHSWKDFLANIKP